MITLFLLQLAYADQRSELSKQLSSGDEVKVRTALNTIGAQKNPQKQVVMIDLLSVELQQVVVKSLYFDRSRDAARLLKKLPNQGGEQVLNFLVQNAIEGEKYLVRNYATMALEELDQLMPLAAEKFIRRAYQDEHLVRRIAATNALRHMKGQEEKAVDHFVGVFTNKNVLFEPSPSEKVYAIVALAKMGTAAQKSVSNLMDTFEDRNVSVQYAAMKTVKEFASDRQVKIPLDRLMAYLKVPKGHRLYNDRARILDIIGAMGHKAYKVVPELIILAKTDSYLAYDIIGTFMKMGAAAKEALPYISNIAVNTKNLRERRNAIIAMDQIIGKLPLYERGKISHKVKAVLNRHAKDLDICQVLCNVADRAPEWAEESTNSHYVSRGHGQLAIASLGALFLSKAAPFCPSAKRQTNQILNSLVAPFKEVPTSCEPQQPSAFSNIGRLVLNDSQVYRLALNANQVYSEQFLIYLYRNLLRRKDLTPFYRRTLERRLEGAEYVLGQDLLMASRLQHGMGSSSLFNNYTLATSMLAHHPRKLDLQKFQEIKKTLKVELPEDMLKNSINPNDPRKIKYSSENDYRPDPYSSAARAIPTHYALYQTATDPVQKEKHRKHLRLSIPNYMLALQLMKAHLRRGDRLDTHEYEAAGAGAARPSSFGIAPYYIYSTLPYMSAITEKLSQEGNAEEQAYFRRIKEDLKLDILSLVNDEGLFYTPEYAGSESYVNALFAMSLIPLAQECVPENSDPEIFHGILD
jgi:hypothetical protein